jgi:hypothetical protein
MQEGQHQQGPQQQQVGGCHGPNNGAELQAHNNRNTA